MSEGSQDELEKYQDRIRELIGTVAAKANIPGLCVELVANGSRISVSTGVVSADSTAPMSGNARFAIGGMSAMLLSLVILELVAAGKLTLDASVGSLLDEFDGSEFGERVLLRHLLSQSGGYRSISFTDVEVRRDFSWDKMVAFLRESSFLFEPGTVFSYSLTAPAILSEIVRRTTGQPLWQFVRARFFEPLGINAGSTARTQTVKDVDVVSHAWNPNAGKFTKVPPFELCDLWTDSVSDLTLSARDITVLLEAVLASRDSGAVTPLLSPQAAALAQQHVLPIPFVTGGNSERLPINVGFAAQEFFPEWWGRNGLAIGQSFAARYHASHKVMLAVGLSVHAPQPCEVVVRELLRSLVGEVPQPEAKLDENMPTPQELSGEYTSVANEKIVLIPARQDVICQLPNTSGAPKSRILMKSDAYKRWVVSSDSGATQLGIFREPVMGTPCVMVGPTAYRKNTEGQRVH